MIPTPKPHLLVASQTHPGMTGKNNEDRFAVAHFRQSASNSTPVLFCVVCDGIGGHRSGEVAAELAVRTIVRTVSSSFGDEPLQTMQRAIQLANEAIYAQAQYEERFHGMGATVAMIWMEGRRLFTTSIGDSRIYLIRKNSIRQVSTDHTWIQEALANGTITPQEAENHPNAHVIRRYLGAPVMPQVDQRLNLRRTDDDAQSLANQGVELREGDSVLICTDGLTDHVKDKEMVGVVNRHVGRNQEAVDELVELACQRGGRDNITVVYITIPIENGIFRKFFRTDAD